MNLGYFMSRGITLFDQSTNHGATLIDLLCKFTSKGHFYPKNKFQEVTEKNKNVLNTGIQGYYSKFKY